MPAERMKVRQRPIRKALTGTDTPVRDALRNLMVGKDMEHVETRLKIKTPVGEEERIYRKVERKPKEERLL